MNSGNEEFKYSENYQQYETEKSAQVVVPVIEEYVTVGKKIVDTARVILSKKINETTEVFETPLTQEQIFIERIPKNEFVNVLPAASRYEGDVMIIPVLKEVAVIEKRMMLVEEIHVSRQKTEKIDLQEVTVRKEEINITRTEL